MAFVLCASHNLHAASTWTGGTGNWSSNLNPGWNGTGVPDAAGATANFNGVISANSIITIDGASGTKRTIGVLNIGNASSGIFTFTVAASSGNALIFDGNGSNAQVNHTAGTSSTGDKISAPILLNSNLDINNAATTNFTISTGGISANTAGTKTITNVSSGSGLVTISASIGDGNGTVAINQNSATSQLTLSSSNSYSGGTTISSGTLQVSAANALGTTGNITFSGGTLNYGTGITDDYSARIKNSNSAIIINAGANTNTVTFNNSIDSSNTGGLSKVGNGTLILNHSNAYSGTTSVSLGTLVLGAANAAPGNVTVGIGSNSALLDINNAAAVGSNNISINANGSIDNTSGAPVILGSGATVTMNANFTFVGSNNLSVTSSSTLGTGSGSARVITVSGSTLTVGGNFGDGTTAKNITKSGTGTLVLAGFNTYDGATTVNGGTLEIKSLSDGGVASGIGAAASSASNLVFEGGTLRYAGTGAQSSNRLFDVQDAGGTLDASGATPADTMTFSGTGTLRATGTVTTARTLTLTGSNTGANTLAPSIIDPTSATTSLAKTGVGSWVLTGTSTYSGGTTISGGTLFANTSVSGASSTGKGTVAVNSGGSLGGLGAIRPTLASGYGVTVAAGGNLAPGGIQPAANFNPSPVNPANGNLTLDPTNITGGHLLSVGTGSNASPSLTFALGSGGTSSQLIVGGTVANTINFNSTGSGNSVVSINDLVGASLNLDSVYTLIQGNGHTTFDDNGSPFALSGANSDLVPFNSTGIASISGDTVYKIVGGLSLVSPNTGGNFFSGWYGSSILLYDATDNNIDVLVVPEPATWAMILGGLASLVFYQRSRQFRSK